MKDVGDPKPPTAGNDVNAILTELSDFNDKVKLEEEDNNAAITLLVTMKKSAAQNTNTRKSSTEH